MTTIRAIGLRAGTISMFPEQHEARQLRHTSTRHVMMRGSQRVPVLGTRASIHGGGGGWWAGDVFLSMHETNQRRPNQNKIHGVWLGVGGGEGEYVRGGGEGGGGGGGGGGSSRLLTYLLRLLQNVLFP